jgi:two-component system NarL family sensor kinase
MKLMLDLAFIYEFENRDSATAIYERTFELANSLNNDLYRGRSIQYRSIVMHDMGKFAESIVGNNKALLYYQKIKYLKGIASTRNNIGNSYLYLADYQNALKNYLLAKPYYSNQQDYLSLVTINGNMGECYRQLKENKLMLQVARESYNFALATGDSLEIANAAISMGSALNLNNQPDSSEFYLQQSLQIAESIQNDNVLFYALFDLADALLKSGKPEAGLPYARRAHDVAVKSESLYLQSGANLLLGRILTKTGANNDAIYALNKGLQLATEIDAAEQRLLILEAFADFYEEKNLPDKSLPYRKAWIALNDSIFNTEKSRQISELHTLYELEEKEQQIENEKLISQKKDEKIRTRNLQVGIALSLALLAASLGWFVWKAQRNKRKMAEQDAIILQQKNDSLLKEQNAIQLKSLIDGQEEERKRLAQELHDGLGGYLTSVHLKAQQLATNTADSELIQEVTEMVSTAGKEMRKISHALAPEGLMRLGLVAALQQYTAKISTSTCTISFETHGEPWSSADFSELSVYRIVQELINNVLKHASASEGFVSLSFLPHELSLVVEDNGKGFDTNSAESDGHGLQNLRARLTYLNATIDVVSKPGKGSSFTITIPKTHVKN